MNIIITASSKERRTITWPKYFWSQLWPPPWRFGSKKYIVFSCLYYPSNFVIIRNVWAKWLLKWRKSYNKTVTLSVIRIFMRVFPVAKELYGEHTNKKHFYKSMSWLEVSTQCGRSSLNRYKQFLHRWNSHGSQKCSSFWRFFNINKGLCIVVQSVS